jgi:hypothetical protein
MGLESTQPITEMSTRDLRGGNIGWPAGRLTSPPSVSRLSRKYGSLDVSQTYGPPWAVTGITIPGMGNMFPFHVEYHKRVLRDI